MAGVLILTAYGVLIFAIDFILKKVRGRCDTGIKSFIFAGGRVKSSTLIFSVFSAWMWTTSLLGAAESFELYGVWGPVAYVVGACIAFAVFVFFIGVLMEKMPDHITYLDCIGDKYGTKTKLFFYIFAFIISAYVLVEQAVGIAYIIEDFFGISFKIVAFVTVMMATAYIMSGGMRNLLAVERITAGVILAGLFIVAICFGKSGNYVDLGKPAAVYGSVFSGDIILHSAIYFIIATVIAFSQLAFDPAYYIKARMADGRKQMKRTYLTGGIALWGSVTLICSMFLGYMSTMTGVDVNLLFFGAAKIIFSIVIVFIGMSTICHYMMGFMGIFAVDFYKTFLRKYADDRQKLVFGRVMTAAIGIFCALVAISLADISLLTIDVFCAIFFAAPCGPFIMSFFSKKSYGRTVVVATVFGIIAGLIVWILSMGHNEWSQLMGMGTSLLVPVALMLAFGRVKGE